MQNAIRPTPENVLFSKYLERNYTEIIVTRIPEWKLTTWSDGSVAIKLY